jgi:hypothetical protein
MDHKDIHPYPSFHHFIKIFCKGLVEEVRGFIPLIFKPYLGYLPWKVRGFKPQNI